MRYGYGIGRRDGMSPLAHVYRMLRASGACWLRTDSAGRMVLDGTDIIVARDMSKVVTPADPVTNGGFDTDTGWTKGTNWTIGSGVASAAGATAAQYLEQNALTNGERFLLECDATVSANSLTPYGGTVAGSAVSSSSSVAQVIVPDGAALRFGGHASGFTGTVDNVVVTPGQHAYQATSANRPTYDSANRRMTFTAASSESLEWMTWPQGGTGSVFIWFYIASPILSAKSIAGSNDGSNASLIRFDAAASGKLQCTAGSGTAYLYSDGQVAAGWHTMCLSWDSSNAYLDVDDEARKTEAGTSTVSSLITLLGANNTGGGAVNHCDVSLSSSFVSTSAISRSEYALLRMLGRNP